MIHEILVEMIEKWEANDGFGFKAWVESDYSGHPEIEDVDDFILHYEKRIREALNG